MCNLSTLSIQSALILHWTSPSKEFQLAWILAGFDAITDIYTEAEVEALFELVQKLVLCSLPPYMEDLVPGLAKQRSRN